MAVRWAVIGSTGIARRRTIPEGIIPAGNATLDVVYSRDRQANHEVARSFGTRAANSLEELLASDIDAVYVGTPNHVHHEQVLACAAAGKHVLCEKPLGLTVEQAREMATACQKAGVLLGTAFMMRYQSQHQEARRLIEEGRLGKPVFARAQLSCWYPPIPGAWRQDPSTGGGGALMDLGGHCIDLLEMLFGPVAKVSCFVSRHVHDYASEDSAATMLVFENGAMGSVDTFFCIPDNSSRNALELYGSNGSILAKGTIGQGPAGEMTAFLESGAGEYDAQQSRTAGGGIPIKPEPVNTYRAEVEAFSAAILDGQPLLADAQAGIRSQVVLNACYESARTGRVIEVQDK